MLKQLGPFFFRPILTFAAAAGVQRQSWTEPLPFLSWKKPGHQSGITTHPQARHGIRVKDREPFERLQVKSSGMNSHLIVRPMRSGNELCARASSDICAEDLVRIVQEGNDQIELREIMHEFCGRFSSTRKDPGQCP